MQKERGDDKKNKRNTMITRGKRIRRLQEQYKENEG